MIKENISHDKVLVVTSDFHAPRALFLFQSVLGKKAQVAVALASVSQGVVSTEVYAHELTDEALAKKLFNWGDVNGHNPVTQTACDDLYQMVLHHQLYRNEWNLIRQYSDVCPLLIT